MIKIDKKVADSLSCKNLKKEVKRVMKIIKRCRIAGYREKRQ